VGVNRIISDFAGKMQAAEGLMQRYRNALRELAK